MKMFSCFRNCLSFSKKKDSDRIQPIVIAGRGFSYHEQERRGSRYKCDGCQQPVFGPYYKHISDCCNLHYHKRCGDILRLDPPPISNHHPYPVGRYIHEERAPSKVRYCIACGDQVRGLRYKVWHEKAHGSSNPYWRLYQHLNYRAFHPLCATLPQQIQAPGEPVVLKLEERIQGQCPICKGKAKGWAYNSTCGNCSYHVGCVKNKIIRSWQPDEEASENGGNKSRIIIHVEIQIPPIQELAAAAIRLIIKALFGFPNIADIFIVLCQLISD
ncbi:uncharacterized protein LOC115726731 [Rhodamnia argentea]|uniref:Uncharacterized protein LOC115726731 n=1 Tax=Rhodamnia argentea TaxID=178133 RepID=A0A8B8MRJ4_9MYRT|nr:uncharacterized protein LOC115726731 [Rhodamnia argentea]